MSRRYTALHSASGTPIVPITSSELNFEVSHPEIDIEEAASSRPLHYDAFIRPCAKTLTIASGPAITKLFELEEMEKELNSLPINNSGDVAVEDLIFFLEMRVNQRGDLFTSQTRRIARQLIDILSERRR